MPNLSKSRFVSGAQCEKKLFFDVNRKDLKPPVSTQKQALFDAGHAIGFLAQQMFQGGLDATIEMNGKWSLAIDRTKSWIQKGQQTIYEAAFSIPNGFAALDILHNQNGERWAIEVKSSTSVKEYHLNDAAFQYFVMNNAGFNPDRFFLMHINKQYVRNGNIDVQNLFHLEEITQQVLERQSWVSATHQRLVQMLVIGSEPQVAIGKHCSEPFSCDYQHHCWKHLPDNNVFNLYSPSGKDWQLYGAGVLAIDDIPVEFPLNPRQQLQVEGAKFQQSYFDKQAINEFVSQFIAPLHFFDFETINPVLPVLDGTRPFQQIPFQYSLHVSDINGNIQDHFEFLPDPSAFKIGLSLEEDPRYQLIQQLKSNIAQTGSIVAYNASFEIGRLKDLAASFPQEEAFLQSLIDRFVDLLIPFKKAWFYLPEMGGSASIKSVLPAIDPQFSYADLKVNNGGDASSIYLAGINGLFQEEWTSTREALLRYCERDSEGMVVVYRALKGLY
jgi:hypothetical protein